MLKWTGALAAAGVVGIGLGFGADLLVRPNTTTTKTSTVTATATSVSTQTGPTVTQTTTSVQTPVPLSYVPPLSASAAARVQQIIQDKVAAEQELTFIPYISPQDDAHCGLGQIGIKNGAVVTVRPEAPIVYPQPVPQFAREDAHMSPTDVFNFKIGDRLSESNIAHPYNNYEADRVIYPMQRVAGTPRATTNGSFVRISWTQAISTIANQMQTDFNKYGPYFVDIGGQRPEVLYPYIFGGCSFKEYGSVSFGTNQVGANQFYGVNPGYNESLGDIQYSKLVIIWGYDPVAIANKANTHYLTRFAKEQGIPVVVIDPRYSISAEVMGSQWIPIRTTTDIQMMCAVAYVLFNENLWDQAYVSQYVEPTGFAKWQSYILGQTAGPDGAIARTPAWAAPICGVPAATIQALAESVRKEQAYLSSPFQRCRETIQRNQPTKGSNVPTGNDRKHRSPRRIHGCLSILEFSSRGLFWINRNGASTGISYQSNSELCSTLSLFWYEARGLNTPQPSGTKAALSQRSNTT